MTSLLHAASIRKRDAQRAKEKVLARERAAEGDAFADKDADVGRFVTGAYQAAIAEAAREEEAERMREEDERRRRKRLGLGAGGTGGMGGLYRGLLEREDVRVAGAMGRVDALIHGGGVGDTGVEQGEQEQVGVEEEEKKKEEVIRNGVAVNEDGQVVDKRDLLTAGLNIKSKPKLKGSSGAGNTGALHSSAGSNGVGYSAGRHAARERQSRMLASQLDAANKRVADEAALEDEAVQRAAKSKKTGAEISGARERYLERKKQKQTQVVEGMEDETI